MSANKSWKKALVPMLMTCVGLAALAGMASIGNAKPVVAADSGTYELVTDAATLTAGKTYIIGGKNGANWFFLSSTQKKNNRGQVTGTVAGTTASWVSGIEELTLGGNATGGWTFYANNSSTKGYLYAASSSSNYLRTQANDNANARWAISVADTGVATMKAKGSNTRNLLRYNSKDSLFSCYGSGQSDVYLYQKAEPVDENKVLNSSLVVEGTLSKTEWIEKEAFSPEGLTIKATYTDSVTYPDVDVTDKIQWSTLKVGDTSITGTYTEGDVTASCAIEGITVIAKSLNKLSIANKTTAFMARTSFTFGSATITAYYDNGEKIVVAADDPNLTVYFGETDITAGYVFKDSDVDTTNKIKLVYADGEKTATTSYSITVTAFVNSIKNVYDSVDGNSVEFWGVYVGSLADGAIVMNGAYGMILYKTSAEASWVVDETVLHVTGTRKSFNKLVEIDGSGINVEVVTDENVISNYVETPINYVLSGSEDATDLSIANRRTFVNGTLKSITASANGSDYNIVVTQDGTDVDLFYKGTDVVAEDLAYLQANVGKTVTIKAFTSFFKTFQARVYGIVEQDASYTAAMFAEEFLAATDTICASYDGSSNKEALVSVWNEFGGAEKWQKLSEEEKAILLSSEKTPCYTNDSADPIENALGRYNFLCKKYELPNFIGREDVASAPVMALQPGFEHQETSSSSTAIAVTTCGLGLVSAASLLLLRRKKQDRE